MRVDCTESFRRVFCGIDREFLSARLRQYRVATHFFMETKSSSGSAGLPRREFIKKSATAAAAVASTSLFKTPVYGQNQAPAPGRVIGANDRITVAVVGVGFGIGKDHLQGLHQK